MDLFEQELGDTELWQPLSQEKFLLTLLMVLG
jgi:hypothetical protein